MKLHPEKPVDAGGVGAWPTDGAVGACWLGVGQERSQQEDGGKQLSSAHHTRDLAREEQRCRNWWGTRTVPNASGS